MYILFTLQFKEVPSERKTRPQK